MKKTNLFIASLIACILLAMSCRTNSAVCGLEVPYTVADGYFVKNDAPSVPVGKITSQEEFFRFFGEATTMSRRPTPIDFTKQFVIAVSQNETDTATTLTPMLLVRSNTGITFTYNVEKGQKQSYRIQPLLLIVVNKKYEADVNFQAQ